MNRNSAVSSPSMHLKPQTARDIRVEAPVDGIDFGRFSRLAGAMTHPKIGRDGLYRVQYRSILAKHGQWRRPVAYAALTILFELGFFAWLLYPGHYPPIYGGLWQQLAAAFVIGTIGLMEILRLINVISLSVASVVSRDPIPVYAPQGLRVAFLTSIVPSKEPLETARITLMAAKRIHYANGVDLWLLDEGNDDAVKAMCREIGVNHFTRKDIAHYNLPAGTFKTRSKHGNYNSWLHAHGDKYDVFMSVDLDHIPRSNFAERVLGYFRDPDVAYVVGPQDYANCEAGFVTMAAESQQFPFHSVIQRAANTYGSAMLVGTNNAFRVAALKAIGGLKDSVTEDLATGLYFHASRNPLTGARWKSVYTPDVLAIGEGPTSWGDYFSQQDRWSRGTFEVLLHDFWRLAPRLRKRQLFHYGLITTFYPSIALGWILGAINALLYATSGISGIDVPPQLWFALYLDATLFQVWLYIWNRQHNVSPFEAKGSFGVAGMAMSVFSSPIYAESFLKTVFRRPAKFVVTPKGSSSSSDSLFTFRKHLLWFSLYAATVVLSIINGFATPTATLWPLMGCLVSLAPIIIWQRESYKARLQAKTSLTTVNLEPLS